MNSDDMKKIKWDSSITLTLPQEVGDGVYLTSSTTFTAAPESVGIPVPERVIFNGRTTIVFFSDGSKEIVRCGDFDEYDADAAVAWAIAHKLFGSKSKFKKFVERNSTTTMTIEEENIRQAVKARKKLDSDDTLF